MSVPAQSASDAYWCAILNEDSPAVLTVIVLLRKRAASTIVETNNDSDALGLRRGGGDWKSSIYLLRDLPILVHSAHVTQKVSVQSTNSYAGRFLDKRRGISN